MGFHPGDFLRKKGIEKKKRCYNKRLMTVIERNSRDNWPKVVVTGFGAVTPLGLDAQTTWKNMLEGKSGVVEYDTGTDIRVAALVKDFEPLNYFEQKDLRRIDRTAQMATAACQEALERAGFIVDGQNKLTSGERERTAIRVGSCISGTHNIIKSLDYMEKGRVPLPLILMVIHSRIVDVLSKRFDIRGGIMTLDAACATGNMALVAAADQIRLGRADMAIAGGVDSCLVPEAIATFEAVQALSKGYQSAEGELRPEKTSRPFDQDANGFVMGEGGIIFFLEREDRARARGATIYARLSGEGESAEAYHETAPDPSAEGEIRTINLALISAGMSPNEVDLVMAHATGTRVGDPVERDALRTVFGESIGKLPVVAIKSLSGHLLAGAGSISQLVAVWAMKERRVPPTINLENPIKGVSTRESDSGELWVPTAVVEREVRVAMVNAFGFGGKNTVVILEKGDYR